VNIRKVVWLEQLVAKIERKHRVNQDEVEEVLSSKPRFFYMREGHFEGEDVYVALGRTSAGRYLAIFFIYKKNRDIIVLSARDMTKREKRRYEKK